MYIIYFNCLLDEGFKVIFKFKGLWAALVCDILQSVTWSSSRCLQVGDSSVYTVKLVACFLQELDSFKIRVFTRLFCTYSTLQKLWNYCFYWGFCFTTWEGFKKQLGVKCFPGWKECPMTLTVKQQGGCITSASELSCGINKGTVLTLRIKDKQKKKKF